ncbi:hypothetical protein FXF51_02330 [Nonomuraea sp. PA05]|uniref:hypothetical protein n=1 Tax=Nonomuraea sp. PA05 TaxID=2604466 RepID=UPI0011D68E0D|nr:hypothetical protein [Nonomuraea sp. PA05]TYB71291.1 hypothetical protein FXF51_02330 [Nonomuraea sp. PA05]
MSNTVTALGKTAALLRADNETLTDQQIIDAQLAIAVLLETLDAFSTTLPPELVAVAQHAAETVLAMYPPEVQPC